MQDEQNVENVGQESPNPFGNDFFGELANYQPELTKDEVDFKPFKGRYVARIAKLQHNIGISQTTNEAYDFYFLSLQVVETIEGDKADRRYLQKRYKNDQEGMKKLFNDLFTAGIDFEKTSREAFDLSLTSMIDKTLKVRAWAWKPTKDRSGNEIPEENQEERQSFVIVKDFAKTKKKETSENIPF